MLNIVYNIYTLYSFQKHTQYLFLLSKKWRVMQLISIGGVKVHSAYTYSLKRLSDHLIVYEYFSISSLNTIPSVFIQKSST